MIFISRTRKLRLLRLIKSRINRHNQILEYSEKVDGLTPYYWPCHEIGRPSRGARIAPDQLRDFQCVYDYRFPTCFCSRESVICISTLPLRKFRNEFVARCESGSCEYLVPVERVYSRAGLNVRIYPRRNIFFAKTRSSGRFVGFAARPFLHDELEPSVIGSSRQSRPQIEVIDLTLPDVDVDIDLSED